MLCCTTELHSVASANRRLLKDERRAAESYRSGRMPEGLAAYSDSFETFV
jgi:hypothetical protein